MSSRASLASDPRDKIYAMLGLASDGEELVPLPNYERPLDFVLEDMTRSILSIQRSPNILFFRSPDRAPTDRLPSWIPDWADLSLIHRPWHSSLAGPDGDAAYIGEMVKNLHHLLAPFSRRMTTMSKPPIQFRGRILEMKGRIVDEVDGISTQMSDEDPASQSERIRRMMVQPLQKRIITPTMMKWLGLSQNASVWTGWNSALGWELERAVAITSRHFPNCLGERFETT